MCSLSSSDELPGVILSKNLREFSSCEFEHFFDRKLAEGVIPRAWLLETLSDTLKSDVNKRVVLISGDPGVGKSTLAAKLVGSSFRGYQGDKSKADDVKTQFSVLGFHVCKTSNAETASASRFVRNLASMLAETVPGYAAELAASPATLKALDKRECDRDPSAALQNGVLAPADQAARDRIRCAWTRCARAGD